MRRKGKKWAEVADETVSVPLSPLIDCVFLLLIFFLVTSMIKKKEKQIPIRLPDITSKLEDEPDEKLHIVGLDKKGKYSVAQGFKDDHGQHYLYPIDDFTQHLQKLDLQDFSPKNFPIRIDADREVSIQTIIDTLDICALQGFENIQLHLLNDRYEPVMRQYRRNYGREW